MRLDGKILAQAREKLDIIRQDNISEQNARQERIYLKIPRMAELDKRMRAQMPELMGITIRNEPDMKEKIAALEKENLEIQAEKLELLVENNYPENWLDDIFSCTKCRDTGYVDGEICSCLMELYNKTLTEELGTLLRNGNECFENFDLLLYDNIPDPMTGTSPRDSMSIVYETCKEYAQNFSNRSLNLLFQGGTGLGKTFLSACIAGVVADKGFSVCYDTAAAALDAFETKKFARDPETAEAAGVQVERMLDCDLMILDDLGTEMPTAMSVSALYTLINTRLSRGKKTVISTNLTDAELARRYSPQICSRISGEFTKLPFAGRDIRAIKKEM